MQAFLYTLVMTHITIAAVTLYLHRSQAHKAVTFNPVIAHFFRFWLWMTTGMVTKQWVAIHRRHHQATDRNGDPHSPHIYGIWKVLFAGAYLYQKASKHAPMINSLGRGTPVDWIEEKVYTPHSRVGIMIMLAIDVFLFGWVGLLIWGIQMLWIPLWAAGVVNGVGHWWGYRNGETDDFSRNILPIGIIIGGEEFHNNHHISPASAKLSKHWFEFDIGWMYIKLLSYLRLANINKK